jgi:uncharacterized protein YqkB
MHIEISAGALSRLFEAKPTEEAALRVAVITEGCGCGADVVFEMNWDYVKPDDLVVAVSPALRMVLDRESAQFFGADLAVDWHERNQAYVLKNKEQIFSNRLLLY